MGCLTEQTIAEYVEGRLRALKVDQVESHIDGCADCRLAMAAAARGLVPSKTLPAPALREDELGATLPGPPPPAPALTEVFPVAHWERYQLLALLGRGGMGAVYKARDPRLNRYIAVKFLHDNQEQQSLRFMQEARAQARIDHPCICKVYEVGEIEGHAYIAMQLIDGLNLQQATKQMGVPDKVQVMRDAALALHAAHELGIIHRDIKPANIMVERSPQPAAGAGYRPVIMDFGLARESSEGNGLTRSGTLMGTPAYMPPEQAQGKSALIDRRSDVYSLGATLYELLTGAPPFRATAMVEILSQVIDQPPTPLRELVPAAPEALEVIVSKCLNKDPVRRYPSARALAEDLDRFLRGEPILGRKLHALHRLGWWARRNKPGAALLALLLVSLGSITSMELRARARTLAQQGQARRQTELAQKLGQEVERLESQMRFAYSCPLHDITAEKEQVRARLGELDRELRATPDGGSGLGHYVLGRGHLLLHSYDQAYAYLKQAEAAGVKDPELDYALGRVLGERYRRALEAAQRGGDKAFLARRKQELDREFGEPIIGYLHKSRGRTKVPANYLQGLIDYHTRQYDAARLNAYFAQRQTPWFYEAFQLEADVYVAQAIEQLARGDYEQAAPNFHKGIERYERATEFGRSDHHLYDALTRAWCSLMALDLNRTLSPQPRLQEVLRTARQGLAASPEESLGYIYLAQAYYTLAKYLQTTDQRDRLQPIHDSIAAGEQGIRLHPEDPDAYRWTANAYLQNAKYLARYRPEQTEQFASTLDRAQEYLVTASKLNPADPGILATQGHLQDMQASSLLDSGNDPHLPVERAVLSFRRAITLDRSQVDNYAQLANVYWKQAQYNAEHGKSSESLLKDAVAATTISFDAGINDSLDRAYLGLIYCAQAKYCLEAGCAAEPLLDKALGYFEATRIRSEQRSYRPYVNLTWAYELRARSFLKHGQDPTEPLRLGRQAATTCLKLAPAESHCYSHQASLLITDSEWRRSRGHSPLPSLQQALPLARQAVQLAGRAQKAHATLLLGRIWWQLALLSMARGEAAQAETTALITQGLAAVATVLRDQPGLPRALVVQDALFRLRDQVAAGALVPHRSP